MNVVAVEHVDSAVAVQELLALLHAPSRKRTVIVMTTLHAGGETPVNVDDVVAAVNGYGDVFVLQSGHLGRLFEDGLPDRAHVFGGAVRVYPPGLKWLTDTALAPLFTCFPGVSDPVTVARRVGEAVHRAATRGATPTVNVFTNTVGAEIPGLAELHAKMTAAPEPVSPSTPGPSRTPKKPVVKKPSAQLERPQEPAPAVEPVTGTANPPETANAAQSARTALLDAIGHVDALQAVVEAAAAQKQLDDARIRGLVTELGSAHRALTVERQKVRPTDDISGTPVVNRLMKTTGGTIPFNWYTDPADAVKHAIYQAWAERVPPTEKTAHPLTEYTVGPQFVDSLTKLDAGQVQKAFRAVVDVLTGLAKDVAGRKPRPLRPSSAGDQPAVTRASDGAVCYRVNVEIAAASARRLHYWKLSNGTVELSRVVTHEDMNP